MTDPGQGFRWTETYSVNIEELDHQHRGLFAIINRLNDALDTGQGARVMDGVLDELLDYAKFHFAAEERLLELHKYPALATHEMEHQAFARNIHKYLEDYRAGKVGAPSALLLFLQSWLREHILKSDKSYSGFLNEKGVR